MLDLQLGENLSRSVGGLVRLDDVLFRRGCSKHTAKVWIGQARENFGEIVTRAKQCDGFPDALSIGEHSEVDAFEERCDRFGIVYKEPEEMAENLAANPRSAVLRDRSSIVSRHWAPYCLAEGGFGNLQ